MSTVTDVRPNGDITWPGGEPDEVRKLCDQQQGGKK